MPRKRRDEKGGILYDGADPAKLLSRGVDLPLHISQQLLRGLHHADLEPTEPEQPPKTNLQL